MSYGLWATRCELWVVYVWLMAHSLFGFAIACQIASWVIGRFSREAPSGASASLTALAIAAGAPR